MQIVCPACDARYDVPDARLAPARRVKCARCGESWMPIGPELELAPEPGPELAPEPDPRREPEPFASVFAAPPLTPAPRRSAPGGRLLWAGWVATALIVIAALVGAVQFRAQIEAAWPPSQRLYDLF